MNSASSAAALVFDLTLCTHTNTEGKPRERPESGIYFKIFEKYTIFNEHLVSTYEELEVILLSRANYYSYHW